MPLVVLACKHRYSAWLMALPVMMASEQVNSLKPDPLHGGLGVVGAWSEERLLDLIAAHLLRRADLPGGLAGQL